MIRPWDVFLIGVLPFLLYLFFKNKKILFFSITIEVLAISVFMFCFLLFCSPNIINLCSTAGRSFYNQTSEKTDPNGLLSWKKNEDLTDDLDSKVDNEVSLIVEHAFKSLKDNILVFPRKAWFSLRENICTLSYMDTSIPRLCFFFFVFSCFLLEGSIKTKKKEILKGIKENWQKVILSLSFITPIFIVPTAGF
jgi:hypothetical protein